MKKSIVLIVAAVISFTTLSAQSSDRALSQGKSSVNVFYGVNLLTSFYKGLASQEAVDVKVTGIGPVGLMYEYMVTDGIGLGVEASYASTNLSYLDPETDANGVVTNYEWNLKFATTRAFFRANFHFTKSENFDAYFFVAAGYRGSSFTVNSTDPTFVKEEYKLPRVVPPYGFKPGLGFRYFFIDNVGINAEIAIGTPVMSAGLSFKF